MSWISASLIVIVLWGVVGLLQKMGSSESSSDSLLYWTCVGYVLLVPALLMHSHLFELSVRSILLGLAAGLTNGLGAWALYAALEKGAAASVAVPLTALNPLVTLILALFFLGERLTLLQTVGVVAALGAAVMLSYEREPVKPDPVLEQSMDAGH
jgi:bacterial/archaeal transporter family protein